MSRKPKLISWQVYYYGAKGRYLGSISAPADDVQAAIRKAIKVFQIPEEKAGKVTAVPSGD